ncbi:MAG: hypothetical protein Q9201_007130 [Fulgogasparrea decipioides]
MGDSHKRKSDDQPPGQKSADKKSKKQWQMPKTKFSNAPSIEPGDAGIWVTCDMHKEGLCTVELKGFFAECAKSFYGEATSSDDHMANANVQGASDDIEAEIRREVSGMQDSKQDSLFVPVKLDIPCVLFFKTRAPVEPVSFVHNVCEAATNEDTRRKTRFVKRLTPMTRMGKATKKSLEEVAKVVLAPMFHVEGTNSQKERFAFAIRPTIRNHHAIERDEIIKRVADLVGERHTVDLKNYDRMILVDVYRNVLGMSVVGSDFEKLKRFNLAEIQDASTPKPDA